MNCLSEEQVARLALGSAEDPDTAEPLTAHVEQCGACRAKLAETGRLIEKLSAAHAELDRKHLKSRAQLLARMSDVKPAARPPGLWDWFPLRPSELTVRQRIAAVGISLSALAAFVLILMAPNSAQPLSAMERMAKELRELKSYSYKTTENVTITQKGKTEPGTVKFTGENFWRAPGFLRGEVKIVLGGNVPAGYHDGQVVANFVEISLVDKPGILIDRVTKSFSQEPKVRAEDTGSGSLTYPIPLLRIIREETGKVVRDLGTKIVQGKRAHGYVMTYKNAAEDSVEVWLDPETDLPVEVTREAKDETTRSVMRLTDFRWNIEFDPKLFDPTAPEGYADITPPTDEKAITQIAAAMNLYADLSGGHYPEIDTFAVNATFDSKGIYDEMLKMAGFIGPEQSLWARDQKFQEIQEAKVGLDWIAKIVRDKNNTGYHGLKVNPTDKDKVLLWWKMWSPERYRVFYGDLRSEILSLDEGNGVIAPRPKIFAEPSDGHQQPAEKH